MEMANGGDLLSYMKRENRPLSEWQIFNWTEQLLLALRYLHERGVAHRDLKLENVLLQDNQGTQLKIADFGFATQVGDKLLQ